MANIGSRIIAILMLVISSFAMAITDRGENAGNQGTCEKGRANRRPSKIMLQKKIEQHGLTAGIREVPQVDAMASMLDAVRKKDMSHKDILGIVGLYAQDPTDLVSLNETIDDIIAEIRADFVISQDVIKQIVDPTWNGYAYGECKKKQKTDIALKNKSEEADVIWSSNVETMRQNAMGRISFDFGTSVESAKIATGEVKIVISEKKKDFYPFITQVQTAWKNRKSLRQQSKFKDDSLFATYQHCYCDSEDDWHLAVLRERKECKTYENNLLHFLMLKCVTGQFANHIKADDALRACMGMDYDPQVPTLETLDSLAVVPPDVKCKGSQKHWADEDCSTDSTWDGHRHCANNFAPWECLRIEKGPSGKNRWTREEAQNVCDQTSDCFGLTDYGCNTRGRLDLCLWSYSGWSVKWNESSGNCLLWQNLHYKAHPKFCSLEPNADYPCQGSWYSTDIWTSGDYPICDDTMKALYDVRQPPYMTWGITAVCERWVSDYGCDAKWSDNCQTDPDEIAKLLGMEHLEQKDINFDWQTRHHPTHQTNMTPADQANAIQNGDYDATLESLSDTQATWSYEHEKIMAQDWVDHPHEIYVWMLCDLACIPSGAPDPNSLLENQPQNRLQSQPPNRLQSQPPNRLQSQPQNRLHSLEAVGAVGVPHALTGGV